MNGAAGHEPISRPTPNHAAMPPRNFHRHEARHDGPRAGHVAMPGAPGALLLAGPPAGAGAESLDAHLARLGPAGLHLAPEAILAAIEAAGLTGRGGGAFPSAAKLATARAAVTPPLVVVNASESEPASGKDRLLCQLRPHLVLDGLALIVWAAGAAEAIVHVHRGSDGTIAALRAAADERRQRGVADPRWHITVGPDSYVSGEASAVASMLAGGPPVPFPHRRPLATEGPGGGRPVLVYNVETVAHVAMITRVGPELWAGLGSPSTPGTRLVTVVGAVAEPGRVFEVSGPASVADVLSTAGVPGVPGAVLIGGYAGTWVDGQTALQLPLDAAGLRTVGASLGSGVIGVLPLGACVLAETARLLEFLTAGSAGQCGPCVQGLPILTASAAGLARGRTSRRSQRQMLRLLEDLPGRGACHLPDGAAHLLSSALRASGADADRHRAGIPCPPGPAGGWLAVPRVPARSSR